MGFRKWTKNVFCLIKKTFGLYKPSCVPHEYVVNIFFTFLSNNCQEKLVTIEQTKKRKKSIAVYGVCFMSLIVLCDTIFK